MWHESCGSLFLHQNVKNNKMFVINVSYNVKTREILILLKVTNHQVMRQRAREEDEQQASYTEAESQFRSASFRGASEVCPSLKAPPDAPSSSCSCTATILRGLTYPKILCSPEKEERKRENGDIAWRRSPLLQPWMHVYIPLLWYLKNSPSKTTKAHSIMDGDNLTSCDVLWKR